jgi:S-adenosylmethionine decarboxylase
VVLRNLKPEIYRERIVIEGFYNLSSLDEEWVERFLRGLSEAMGMKVIAGPLVFSPNRFSELHHGVGGYVAWVASGVTFYSWDTAKFFTLDVYSCKPLDVNQLLTYVKSMVLSDDIVWCKIEYDT